MESFLRKAFRSSNVIGMAVKTADHMKIGEIEEIVLDVETGKIAYVVMSFGGHFGLGDKFFAVPWEEFKLIRDENNNYFVVDTNASKLRKLPGFNKKDWPDTANADWDGHVDKHYQRAIPVDDEEAWIEKVGG